MPALCRFPVAPLTALLLAALTCVPANAGNLQNPILVGAASRGDLAAVTALLNDGADVNYSRGDSGQTALMGAAAAGHVEVMRALIAAGAGVNNRSKGGWTALLHAVTEGKLEAVRELLAAKADPDICATQYAQCRGPLMAALANGNLTIARALLDGGAGVNTTTSYGATPLRFAVWGDGPERIAMLKALLEKGADVDAGQVPTYGIKDNPYAQVMLTRTAEGTALGDMAADRSAGFVKVLLDAGAKVDARQPGWRTPLMIASIGGNLPVVRLLLDAGADVNAKDSNGRTALDLAVANGRREVAGLLRNGAARAPQ